MGNLTGKTLDYYQMQEPIGRGGMATVFKAIDSRDGSLVAIKVLSPAMAENPQFSQRFRREVTVVQDLKHPNIVPVLDFGEADGYAYLVMPYLRAGSLADRLSKRPLTPDEGARVIDDLADALDFAHQQDIVHRDVKPSNILLDEDGRALLSDFGLVHIHDASLSLTGSALIGTPTYISPEQARGESIDARSDQYSLGIILYQLVTGRLPFEGETPLGVLMKHISEPIPAPRSLSPNIPVGIERVILKATAKDPKDRFPNVKDLATAFRSALAHARDPRTHPAPEIRLPASTTIQRSGTWLAKSSAEHRAYLRLVIPVVLLLLVALLALPVVSTGLLSLLDRAAHPVAGSGETITAGDPGQLTALAATIAALSTDVAGPPVAQLHFYGATQQTTSYPTLAPTGLFTTQHPVGNSQGSPTPGGDGYTEPPFQETHLYTPSPPVGGGSGSDPTATQASSPTPQATFPLASPSSTWPSASQATPTSTPVPPTSPVPRPSASHTHLPSATFPATPTPTKVASRTPSPSPTATHTPVAIPTISLLRGSLYLHNNPSPPLGNTTSHSSLPMDPLPALGVMLFNYDTDRDSDAGLRIKKGGSGPDEADPKKRQRWRTDPFPGTKRVEGSPHLIFWSAIKDFDDDKRGSVRAFLAATNGSALAWSTSGSVQSDEWHQNSEGWVEKTLTFDAVEGTIPEGYWLELILIVPGGAEEDMWFAYDNTSQPTRLVWP